MDKEILLKELYIFLHEGKVQILCIISIILVFLITFLGVIDYNKKVDNYNILQKANIENLKNNKVYATIAPTCIRPPEPLSIFCKGINEQIGQVIPFSHMDIPYKAKQISNSNPYIAAFLRFDTLDVLVILLSLIAIFISHDLITRENEENTLSLILSTSTSRTSLIISKILAAISFLSIILIIIFTLIVLFLLITPFVKFDAEILCSIILLFIAFLIYSTLWVMVGTISSVLSKNSLLALFTSLTIWISFMFIVPTLIKVNLGQSHFYSEKRTIEIQYGKINNSFEKVKKSLLDKYLTPIQKSGDFNVAEGGVDVYPVWYPNYPTKIALHDYFKEIYPYMEDATNKKFRISETYFLKQHKQKYQTANYISFISPNLLTKYIAKICTKTSYDEYYHFYDQCYEYRRQVMNYFENKKAYETYLWFEPGVDKYYEPFGPGHPLWFKDVNNPTVKELENINKYRNQVVTDPRLNIDLSDFPTFRFVPSKVGEIIRLIILPFIIFIIVILMLFILSIKLFNKYDI